MKAIWNNFKVAFAMYSKIPVPQADWEKENMKYALCFFPWVGLVIGITEALAFRFLDWLSAGALFRAAVLTALPVLITGGIHLDGFLDTMDALSSWREKEKRLAILKDPHAGAFAVLMGCLYFVLYFGCASEVTKEILPALAAGFGISRAFSGLSILFFPNANPRGTAAKFGMSAEKKITAAVLVITVVVCTGVAACFTPAGAFLVLLVSLLVWFYYRWKSKKFFGGITGDLAGYFLCLCEFFQILVLVLFTLGMERMR